MEVEQKHKFKQEQKQPWKSKEVSGKENSSFTTDSRSRKSSIGITVAFSNRNLKVYELPPLKSRKKAYSTVCGSGKKTWTPHTPLKPQKMAPPISQPPQNGIISPNREELQMQSAQIVEEVYGNRKSPLHSTGFAARRETNFVKYERRGKKENLAGELRIERSQHVKFNFNSSSPSPSSSQQKHRSNDNSPDIALRAKLRNALGLLNSSSPEKQQAQGAAPQNESKSDTIETESDEIKRTAKPVKPKVQQRGKKNPSPLAHTNIISFDQDEVECDDNL